MPAPNKESPPGDTAGFKDAQAGGGVQVNGDAAGPSGVAAVSGLRTNVVPFVGWLTGEKLKSLWKLLGRATRDARLSRGDIVILYSIADRVSDSNVAWPGIDRLATDTGTHRSTVIRSVDRLELYGYLLRESGGIGKANRYRLLSSVDAAGRADATGSADATEGVAPTRLGGVAPTRPESTQLNQPSEPTQKKARAKDSRKPKVMPMAAPEWLSEQAWTDWHEYRLTTTPKKWTLKAQELSIATLTRLRSEGHEPVKVIEQSIENGWAGLFPLKSNKPSRGTNNADHTHRPLSAVERVRAHIVAAEQRDADAAVGHVAAYLVAPHG